MLVADWLSQVHLKNYGNFSHVVIGFFSVAEIPIKYSSLYNKMLLNLERKTIYIHKNNKEASQTFPFSLKN